MLRADHLLDDLALFEFARFSSGRRGDLCPRNTCQKRKEKYSLRHSHRSSITDKSAVGSDVDLGFCTRRTIQSTF